MFSLGDFDGPIFGKIDQLNSSSSCNCNCKLADGVWMCAGNWGNMPLFGTLADQSTMMAAAGLPVDNGMVQSQQTAAAAVGMHVGYPAMMNDINAMMMSDMYHGNMSAVDQSAVKHMLHSVTNTAFIFPCAATTILVTIGNELVK